MIPILQRVIKNWKHVKDLDITNTNFIYNNSGIKGRSYAIQNTSKLFKEIFAEYKLYPEKIEDRLGIMLLKQDQDGAYAVKHRDIAPKGYNHVRVNVMLKKPPKGGDAVINDIIIKLEENDIWLIYPNLEDHGSTPIYGGTRLVYSFGGLILDKNNI